MRQYDDDAAGSSATFAYDYKQEHNLDGVTDEEKLDQQSPMQGKRRKGKAKSVSHPKKGRCLKSKQKTKARK